MTAKVSWIRMAVIADVHGNADALRAVLSDIARRDVEGIVNLGDHVSGPLAAGETADMLMTSAMVSIRGNHDRWLVERPAGEMGASDLAALRLLGPDHLDWLTGLPPVLHLPNGVFICHATPYSDTAYWLQKVTPSGAITSRVIEEIAAEAEGIDAGLILCGHTHLPRRVDLPDGRTILNPGSVGCPGYDDDMPVFHVMESGTAAACYAVVERNDAGWASSFHHVPYDTSRMAAMAVAAGRPEWASAVRTGWVRGVHSE